MKFFSIISKHQSCGQTTIVINLATGLMHKGYKVLVVDLGENEKLLNWVSSSKQRDKSAVFTSPLGIDVLSISMEEINSFDESINFSSLDKLGYDYVLVQMSPKIDYKQSKVIVGSAIVCTDLSHDEELAELQVLEDGMQTIDGKDSEFKLIILNKINNKDWEHNNQQLSGLVDYYGFDKIAEPIPFCERIHDLPLDNATVWQLNHDYLREPFMELIELIESI